MNRQVLLPRLRYDSVTARLLVWMSVTRLPDGRDGVTALTCNVVTS